MTGLPIGKGRSQFFSQRVDGRPFVNCMMYSLSTVLRWMGYEVPVEPDGTSHYGMTLRVASGRSLYSDGTDDGSRGGVPQGSTIADTRKALAKLLPNAPVQYGVLTPDQLFDILRVPGRGRQRKAVVRVTLRPILLPRFYRRFVGYDWAGKHAATLVGKRVCNGGDGGERHAYHINVREVLYLDPMGRKQPDGDPYAPDWLPLDNLLDAVDRQALSDGSRGVVVTYGYRDSAVAEPEEA